VQTVLAGVPTVARRVADDIAVMHRSARDRPRPWALMTNTWPPKPVNCVDHGSGALT